MKKYLILAAVTLAALGGLLLLPAAAAREQEVTVVSPKTFSYTETFTATGRVEEEGEVEVTPSFPLVPGEVLCRVGDILSPGQVIATVDQEATRKALADCLSQYAGMVSEALPALLSTAANEFLEKLTLPETILSPGTGVLTALSLTPGVLFLPQTAAAVISSAGPLTLRLTVNEADIGRVTPGERFFFTASAVEGGQFAARVDRILPTARQQLQGLSYETVVEVTALIEEDFGVLRPGYSVRARLGGEEEELLLVPYQAVVREADGSSCLYLYENGFARRRKVETGRELSTSTAITAGLSPEELVIADPSSLHGEGPVRLAGQEE